MRLIDADALKINSWGYRVLVNVTCPTIQVVSFEEIDMAPTIDPESLRPKGEWVSVSEGLPHFSPEKWRKVLVTIEDERGERFVSTAKYHEEYHYWYEFTRGRFYNSDKLRVVAWMERPAPYGGADMKKAVRTDG